MAEETTQDEMVIGEAPEDTPMPDSQKSGLLSAEQDERIAQFFVDHPFFYDKTLSDYTVELTVDLPVISMAS